MSVGKTVVMVVLALAMFTAGAGAQQNPGPAVAIDDDDIGGVVTSRFGPEAGVWVIAQTTELSTRFAKIAVTDERGGYVVPDLPHAHYQVWVRGYGWSTRQRSRPSRARSST
ncbi:MAG: carboxypeptidase regulatory-like domain-containing protein, partial [Bradyrhizobium sp.]|nr:carboxypeptidase regulatory-like domain-containing protein [Bradyrhizobium sp.]